MKLLKPRLNDISAMQVLVQSEVESGIILERNSDEMATNIRSYVVVKEKEEILGYAALHIHSSRVAEIRSLIVSQKERKKGIAKKLIGYLLDEAKTLSVEEDILVLTYIPEFFSKMGFVEIQKEQIPEHKIWTDCIKCIHFPVCNEVAMVYKVG